MAKVTITDIAKMVGVSKATVSYYLNGNTSKMSLATQEKIRQIIEETGYQPNKIAQSLATKDTKTIGVVIADITNPFISSVMKGIHDQCQEEGYSVLFTNSDDTPEIEAENIHRLLQQNVSGILLDPIDANLPNLKQLDPKKTVMIDRESKDMFLDTVVSNNSDSTREFLAQMKARGYRDLYFVTYPIEGISTREQRYQGFCEEVGADSDRLLVLGEQGTSEKILDLLAAAKRGLGFFTMNGPVLLEFMKLINGTPYQYPSDFGLGSYEDLDWMQVLNPSISCVRQDSYRIGRVSANHLLGKLQGEEEQGATQRLVVPSELVLRKSF
ncbi:LacI family DNA-binding transcriptional regulator [Streptococcus danieliae]|uniref:LacI family DNA-binding transcriptional regulator n=1 Tax=Streptococcus danieliae TaxID=747656 RepID=A0A7X3KC22_9STRE|nr:LacI family DNA-binding transcriptional regulator [Streptococcus danieliae]